MRMSSKKYRADLIARYPATLAAFPPPPPVLEPLDPEEALYLSFDAVPRQRRRRNGWTDDSQRAFIALLARCGCVARAARSVGMAPRSAYRLRDADGADGFAEAWDRSIDMGIARLRAEALDRALNGVMVPVYRRGKLVRVEHRRCDRLAIALLSGRDRAIDDNRRSVVGRRRYWADVRARDDRLAAEQRERDDNWAAHQAIIDQAEEDKRLRRSRSNPRVRRL